MKYQIGDKILVLHSKEEGEIIDIINDKMVMIEVDNVRFPVYMDQIDFPYFQRFSDKKFAEKRKDKKHIDDVRKEKPAPRYKVSEGVWLSFLPLFDKEVFDDDVVESFKLYLINQTNEGYNFSYNLNFVKSPGFELKNQLHPFTDFYLHDVLLEQMNDVPKFEFEFSLLNPDKKRAEYFETSLKIKAKQLFQKIEEVRLKNEPTFTYKLLEKYPDKIIEDKPDIGNLYAKDFKIYDASQAGRAS